MKVVYIGLIFLFIQNGYGESPPEPEGISSTLASPTTNSEKNGDVTTKTKIPIDIIYITLVKHPEEDTTTTTMKMNGTLAMMEMVQQGPSDSDVFIGTIAGGIFAGLTVLLSVIILM